MTDVKAPQVYSLFIINKAGSLIYSKDFTGTHKLNANDYLRLASTFHGLHAITGRGIHTFTTQADANVAVANAGIMSIEARCYQTLTGIKFLMTGAPNHNTMDKLLAQIYTLYTDYVLKNPFYELDMPIRAELFEVNLLKLLAGSIPAR